MPETPQLSEAKRALLEKYRRGEIEPKQAIKEVRLIDNVSTPATQISTESLLVPVVPIRSTGTRRPFFYSHVHVDGGAFYCFSLADRLGPDQPFYILEPYRFYAGGIPPSLEAMATEYVKSMRTVQPKGPYLLGGFCGGGLIVFEMAHQLRELGEEVDLLLLVEPVDGPGPATYRRLVREAGGRAMRGFAKVLRLSPQKQLDWFLRIRYYYLLLRYPQYRKTQTTWLFPSKETLYKDWIGIFVWIISAYNPIKYSGKVTYLWAREEFLSRREWRGKQAEAVEREVHLISGNHWSCRVEYLQDFADCLNECVNKAQEIRPG